EGLRDFRQREEELLKSLTSGQTKRLQQIIWQQRGAFALTDPEVATALELPAEQRQAIRRTIEEFDLGRRMTGRRRRGPPDESRTAEMSTGKLEERILAVLTDDQRGIWDRLTGPPFTGSLNTDLTRDPREAGRRPFRPR